MYGDIENMVVVAPLSNLFVDTCHKQYYDQFYMYYIEKEEHVKEGNETHNLDDC